MKHPDIAKSRRRLPHWKVDGAIYWITFRLADSIPREKYEVWKVARDEWSDAFPKPWSESVWTEYRLLFGDQWDTWLDEGMGSCALARADVREEVKTCLLRFEGERLALHAAVIMPTHVHLLLEPLADPSGGDRQGEMPVFHDLSTILKGIKGASARAVNKVLGTSGTFWLDESFDHIVRSEAQYHHYLKYVAENPIKAGLKSSEFWLFVGD
jgi:putative transposase